MKKLARAAELLMGVVDQGEDGKLWLRAVDKKVRRDTPISDIGQAKPGDLVLAEPAGRLPRISARVTDVLGDPFAPRSFSLIAIHKYGIPFAFPEEVEEERSEEHTSELQSLMRNSYAVFCLKKKKQ